ncbi:Alpha/Beta hydrolase protein [Helicostylum pulchrum]|nr:Alpha/Beta hydrolase protein [Helicostylum pulchrum]
MGDDCCNPESMGRVKGLLESQLPGTFIYSVRVGDTTESDHKAGFFGKINDQVDAVCEELSSIPELMNGFNAIGFSQGGLLLRTYVERCNRPAIHRLITFGSPHGGVSDIPNCMNPRDFTCRLMRSMVKSGVYSNYIQNRIIQAQYYRDKGYLEKNQFLPFINNELVDEKNESYKENIQSLDKLILIRFSEDVMIKPGFSAWFWIDNDQGELVPLQNQTLYKNDWLGLKSLNNQGRLEFLVCPGQHMQISDEYLKSIEDRCPNTEYGIPVERFAQLLSTHWQFDHLDSIKSGTYKIISELFQEHIKISIEATNNDNDKNAPFINNQRQKSFNTVRSSSSWDTMMDLEILHAQIFGAIQAHTEGSLHIAWDRLSDKLGQPAFEMYIRMIALKHCTLDIKEEDEGDYLSSTCLKEKASALSLELDEYININLNAVFMALEKDILPNLLANTSKDLSDVLAYFNRLFLLKDNQHLYLQVIPWSTEQSDLKSKLLPLLERSVLNDDHLTDFFESYACLSRA